MRKTFFVLMALTVFIISCDNDPMSETNPFIGEWITDGATLRWVFTETYVVTYKPDGEKSWFGSYTYNDTHITVHTDYREPILQNLGIYPEPFVYAYTFKNDLLVIDDMVGLTKI